MATEPREDDRSARRPFGAPVSLPNEGKRRDETLPPRTRVRMHSRHEALIRDGQGEAERQARI